MSMNATMRALDVARGAIRVEDVFDTDIHDLWEACTKPERVARWIAEVTGDMRVGGSIHLTFTSTWDGPARIDVCEAPHHLLITGEPGTADETQTEVWLTSEGPRSRLVVEERGLPIDQLHFHAAGWQVHLEDLGRALELDGTAHPDGWSASEASPAWRERWVELTSAYETEPVAGVGGGD